MRIAIIGAGKLGVATARLLANAGHDLFLANFRGPATLKSIVSEMGLRTTAMTTRDAASAGDIIFLSVPWGSQSTLSFTDLVVDKIIIDTVNPIIANGTVVELGKQTSSEIIMQQFPRSRIVKAFNTIWYRHLLERSRLDVPINDRQAIFLAGDEDRAKTIVASLIAECGFAPVDTGGLNEGGLMQQPGGPLFDIVFTGNSGTELIRELRSSSRFRF